MLFVVGITFWNIVQIARKSSLAAERLFLLVLAGIFTALCLWGSPADYAWQVFIVLPFTALTALALSDGLQRIPTPKPEKWPAIIVVIIVLGLLWRNYTVTILPMHQSKGKDYSHAKAIDEALPKSCLVFEINQGIYQNLIYYFERQTVDYWDIITAFHHGDPEATLGRIISTETKRSSCIAVDSKLLDPVANVSGQNGFTNPRQWDSMMRWQFDLEPTGSGQFSWRKFDIVSSRNGHNYIVFHPVQRQFADTPDGFLRQLIELTQPKEAATAQNYRRWLETHSLQ